jgi:hypothetical protein
MPGHGFSRRRLLQTSAALAAATGLAGCSSDGESGDGGDESGEGNSGTTVQDLCSRFSGEFVAYDVGAVPTICDFDIPATLEGNPSSGDLPGSNGWGVESDATNPGRIGISVGINFEETAVSDEPGESLGEPAVTDVEFGSETVTLYSLEEANLSDERHEIHSLKGDLPYTVGDTKLYFPIDITSSVEAGTDESIPEDCRASVMEVAHRVGESLRVNEETTVEAHLEERWDDPP